MGIADNYRTSADYREILRILQKASSLQENFLWQSHALGRNIVPIHHFEIDFVTREVVLYFDTHRYMIDRELPLYLKVDYRTSVFKITEFRQDQSAVYFSFPEEIKTLELRGFPRHQFAANDEKSVSLRPSITGKRETGTEMNVRVMDISHYGLGLIVSEHNRSFLKNNRILWVTKLGDQPLQYPILGEVVYINNEVDTRYIVRKQKEMKVGLKLSGVFPSDIYDRFLL